MIPSLIVLDFLRREPGHVCKSKFILHHEIGDNGTVTETFWLQYLDSGRGRAHCVTPTALSSQLHFTFLVSAFMGIQQTWTDISIYLNMRWLNIDCIHNLSMQLYIFSLILCNILWYSVIFRMVFAGLMFYWWSPPSNSSEYQTAKPSHWLTDLAIPLEHAQATWKINKKSCKHNTNRIPIPTAGDLSHR